MCADGGGRGYDMSYCMAGKVSDACVPGCAGVILYVCVFNVLNLIQLHYFMWQSWCERRNISV